MKQIEIDNYILIPTEGQTKKEWLEERTKGIGGSDMGVIFNVSEYYSSTELFYEKLGRTNPKDLSKNASVFWGSAFEDPIRKVSENHDPNGPEDNIFEGIKRASHVPFPYMVINKKFPWIICNVDALGYHDTNVTEQDVIDQVESGKMPTPDYIVEIKTMNPYTKDKYALGIMPTYPYQVKTYCTAFLEKNPDIYGMIYVFCYDLSFTAYDVRLGESDIKSILEVSKKFDVLLGQGKEIIKEGYKAKLNEDEIDQNLSQIHPEPKSSIVSHGQFLSQHFLSKEFIRKNETIKGGDEDIALGLRMKEINDKKKELDKEKTSISNQIKAKMVRKKAKVIDTKRGKLSYGKRLTNSIK